MFTALILTAGKNNGYDSKLRSLRKTPHPGGKSERKNGLEDMQKGTQRNVKARRMN